MELNFKFTYNIPKELIKAQKGVYEDAKYKWDAHIVGLNTPNADAYMPIEEARSHLKDVSFTVPYRKNYFGETQLLPKCQVARYQHKADTPDML